jgi:hypothetical protein
MKLPYPQYLAARSAEPIKLLSPRACAASCTTQAEANLLKSTINRLQRYGYSTSLESNEQIDMTKLDNCIKASAQGEDSDRRNSESAIHVRLALKADLARLGMIP